MDATDLSGYGAFTATPAGFQIRKPHLDERWNYLLATRHILLKVDQSGIDTIQFQPPAGTVLLKRERFQRHSSCLVWLKVDDGPAFTNFASLALGGVAEACEFTCDYTPERAVYRVQRQGLCCETELMVLSDDAVAVMTCTVTNQADVPRSLTLWPVLRPHLAAASLAPWDTPALYQSIRYAYEGAQCFRLELRSPAGLPADRQYAFCLSDLEDPDGVELFYEAFVGHGSFERPDALDGTPFSLCPRTWRANGTDAPGASVNGQQGVIALKKTLVLSPGQTVRFSLVMGQAPRSSESAGGAAWDSVLSFRKYFDPAARLEVMDRQRRAFGEFCARRHFAGPDAALARYVNEFLPLQLQWVNLLDRGWPTGMRGTRDSAQDATALTPLDPAAVRQRILEIACAQRQDGWFPRQYAVAGPQGPHDLRDYVDGGVWVWELNYDYLCTTKDWAILREPLGFLEDVPPAPLLDHIVRLAAYYVRPENLGEHGLCLIRAGDWNDSVNRAGLAGRGESVMVSCQVVALLRQAAALLDVLAQTRWPGIADVGDQAAQWRGQAEALQQNLLRHAYNAEGYFNGVYTDGGAWVFSPCDPDGQRRVNVPVNAFAIIAGIVRGADAARLLDRLEAMKRRDGWPLFYPGIGEPPIEHLGRIGTGDLSVGLGENGTPYNHGAHGFLGRAAAVGGRGDLLLEVLRFMLPYDQTAHPVERAKTAPYGMVNHWKTAPGQEGRGGDLFLSGSISTALRNVYGGLFGIRPKLGGLVIDPCWPSAWPSATVWLTYCGAFLEIRYERVESGAVPLRIFCDGTEIHDRVDDEVVDRKLFIIADGHFRKGEQHCVTCQINPHGQY